MNNKLIIASLFVLVIFTLGAVSAADDSVDNLTVDEVDNSISQTPSGEDELNIEESDISQSVGDDDKKEPSMNVKFYSKDDEDNIYLINGSNIFADNHDNSYIGVKLSDDARGNASLYIDNIYRGNVAIHGKIRYFYANKETYNLTFGKHDWEIKYSGDENYHSKTMNGTFYLNPLTHNIKEYVYMGDYISFEFARNAKGKLNIIIDDNWNYNYSILRDDDIDSFVRNIDFIKDLNFGIHNYKVIYTDEKYGTFEETGKFNLTYDFYLTDFPDYDLIYGEEYSIDVCLPKDASSDLQYTINDKKFKTKVSMVGGASIKLSNLKIGVNEIKLTYSDKKYPVKTITENFTVFAKFNVNSDEFEYGDSYICSLTLPQDATGNLHIYKYGDYDYDMDEWSKVTIEKIPVVNGHVEYVLPNLNTQEYNFYIEYDGKDYEVEECPVYFKVSPKLMSPRIVWNESDKNTVTVNMPDNFTANIKIIISDGDDEEKIIFDAKKTGKFNLNLPKLDVGEYNIHVKGNTEDYSFSQGHELIVVSASPDTTMNVSLKKEKRYGFDSDIFEHLTLPGYCDGRLVLIVDGNIMYDCPCSQGTNQMTMGDWSIGYHDVEFRFENDSYYRSSSVSGKIYMTYFDIPEGDVTTLDAFYCNVDEKATGYVSLFIDGKLYDAGYLDNGGVLLFLDEVSLGQHTFEIKYSGDSKHVSESRTGTINVSYPMNIGYWDLDYDELDAWDYGDFECYIEIPSDATGYVTLYIDGNKTKILKEFRPVYNDPDMIMAEFSLSNLSVGVHNIKVTYSDSKYPFKSVERNFTILPSYVIKHPYFDVDYMKNISLILPSNATGNLVVIINGTEHKVKMVEGYASYSLSQVGFGEYVISAYYDGDDYDVSPFNMDEESDMFRITPKIINNYTYIITEDNLITIEVPKEITGKFNLTIGKAEGYDKSYDLFNTTVVSIVDGKASFSVRNLPFGSFNIRFDYVGESNIPSVETTFRISVKDDIDGKVFTDKNVNPTIKLPNDVNGEVNAKINGKYVKIPIKNGIISIPFENLNQDENNLIIEYHHDKYGDFSREYVFDVDTVSMEITNPSNSATNSIINIQLPNDATGEVVLFIGKKEWKQSISNGKASISIPKLPLGNVEVLVAYSGDNKYKPFSHKDILSIKEAKVVASDLSMIYTDGSKYSVKVYDIAGKLASGVNVIFKINGKKEGTAKTNAKGVASFKLNKIPGKYKITTEALGVSVTKKLTVKHVLTLNNIKVKKSAKKLVLKATLKKIKGKYLKGKKITFKFNGKKYTAKTSKKGVAKVIIKKSGFKKLKKGKKITYSATYLKDTIKKTVKVKN